MNVVYFYCNTLTIVTNLVFNLVKFKVLASLGSNFDLGMVPPPPSVGSRLGSRSRSSVSLRSRARSRGEFEWCVLLRFDGVIWKGDTYEY